ncbi:Poliovirus receptor [Oryzias melastigma]|uniref:Poliovirus receptor n=1 Tax=Oryzias melastigma TaxID=30732 RepID=A0A834CDV4_ORYME|nr:Poliovirus receptor [Oryzias melastigma]
MRCSRLISLALFLHVARSLEIQGEESSLQISENVTVVLGEDVYLSCEYLGKSQIQSAAWKRQTNESNFEGLVGFSNRSLFNNFSNPDSITNLTVQVKVSSVEAEGEYICEFKSEEEFFFKSVFITVLGRPDVQILVSEELINNTSYQSVTCFADGGRPPPQISWLVGSLPPSGYPFTVNVSQSLSSNGLHNLSSVLRFPTHLQNEDNVTCVIQHPALPHPKLATVRVETYARPNVTIKAEMVQERGRDFWVVSCISSGGRPDTDISLALNITEGLQAKKDSDVQSLSVHLPAAEYDGRSLTCMFTHPKFTHMEERSITLPAFYLHKVGTAGSNFQDAECLELQEGETDAISLQITSNVPRYSLICTKDDGPLPDNVELIGQNLTFLSGVKHQHAGLYECRFSYHHLNAALRFNVTVKPRPLQPVPPTISVGLHREDGRWVIECVAAEAVPAASVSWLVSQSVSEEFWVNSTSYNGSRTVRGVFLVPVCSPWELTAKCVIHHPAFERPENRSVTLPLCARPNVTVNTSTEWKDGRKYTKVCCSVISVSSAADILWLSEDGSNITDVVQTELLAEGLVSAWSSVDLPSSQFSGQNLTCVVKHASLETPAERTIHIPEHKPPLLSVTVVRDPPLWQAVCVCEGECIRTNLHWVLPKRARTEPPPLAEFEDNVMKATLTYQFPLALLEGQNLTCVYQFDHRVTENRTVQIPKYYITSVRILNRSSLLRGHHNDHSVVYGLTVQKNHLSQRILLDVEGNVPEYNLHCQRSDGSAVDVDESAMILQDEGLYTCWASFYHHKASVTFQVEIMDEGEQFMQIIVICISSVTAVLLISGVVLLVFCKKDKRTKYKEQESVSALSSLMQESGSPEVKKPAAAENKGIAQLDNYAIVLDVKSAL